MKEPNDCTYNIGVECNPVCRNCWRCGWNPNVKEQRTQRILQTKSYKQNRQMDFEAVG